MAERDNPVTVYLTDGEKADLEQWADESGKSVSELSRQAIREYTDRDRFERIEDKLDRVLSSLDGGDENTRTSHSKQMSVPETARAIAKRIYSNHEPPIKSVDVELAIEDIGGATERTVEQYKRQLKKRGLLWEHPASEVWTDSRQQWVKWVEGVWVGDDDLHDYTDPYPMDAVEYDEIAEQIEVTQ
jgi:predicted transcriptional regulator